MAPPDSPPAPPAHRVRHVLVVDDHDLIRLGLQALAADLPGLRVSEARTLREALEQQATSPADVVLLDLHLPDAHGLTALTTFRQRFADTPVLVLSGNSDPSLAQRARSAGAQAFLPKAGNLQTVIDLLTRGQVPAASPQTNRPAAPPGPHAGLSPRQTEVLDWVLAGLSNRDIADRLGIGEGTVKNHVSTLLLSFGVRTRSELISRLR